MIFANSSNEGNFMEPSHKHFAVYTSSVGNYFFEEISGLIIAGLRSLGMEVTASDEKAPYLSNADWHVIVAPHEFFYLGEGEARRREGLPENSIIVNTEQPSTQWFALAHTMFRHAKAIWDIDYNSARRISAQGIECSYLPLGYVPEFETYARIDKLPHTIAPNALSAAEKKHSNLYDPWTKRPIDILFMGNMSSKRDRFFAQFDKVAAKYNSYLHKIRAGGPLVPGQPWYLGTSGSAGLAQRSKIVLNIHRGNDVYFEWHRVVMLGIWQRALVITEPCTSAPPFKPGVDYVEVSSERIPGLVEHFLSTHDGQKEAQAIIDHGYETLTEDCRITNYLTHLVSDLDNAKRVRSSREITLSDSTDSVIMQDKAPSARKRICVVIGRNETYTRDIGGPAGMKRLADLLASVGHDVTVLHAAWDWRKTESEESDPNATVAFPIVHLTLPSMPSIRYEFAGQHTIDSSNAYLWLRENEFDVVHFPDTEGVGFYSLLAKHQGIAFQHTKIVVHVHGPAQRISKLNSKFYTHLRDLEVDFMEQECIRLADDIASQFDTPLSWMASEGWEMKGRKFVNPYPVTLNQTYGLPQTMKSGRKQIVLLSSRITTDVLGLFADAVKRVRTKLHDKITVAVISLLPPERPREINTGIKILSEKLGSQVTLKIARTLSEASKFLSEHSGVVVVLSPDENLQELVLNLCFMGVPFLTTLMEGMGNLMPASLRDRVFAFPKADSISSKIAHILGGEVTSHQAVADRKDIEQMWVRWSTALTENTIGARGEERDCAISASLLPLVSVCIVHHNRPHYVADALASIEKQDYPNFEVVLVDDGSDNPEALRYLADLEPKFQKLGWKIIMQQNRYLGAARNEAARHANGEYIMFMDDDNVAKPQEISTFIKVALRTNADILTCVNEVFSGKIIPGEGQGRRRWLHIGPALSVGVFKNCFGDANAFIRRRTFEEVGGFTEDYGITHEDWEFFANAVMKGAKLEVIPEALFWYRSSSGSMVHTTNLYANMMRSLRPYLNLVPSPLKPFVFFGLGLNAFRNQASSMAHTDEVVELVHASRSLFDMKQYESGVMVMYSALDLALKAKRGGLAEEIMMVLQKPNFKAVLAKKGINLDNLSLSPVPVENSEGVADQASSAVLAEARSLAPPKPDEDVPCSRSLSSIIILTFNQLEYTKITIDSLRRYTTSPYELIVIDNASTDGTIEYLKAQKDIRTVFNEKNLGFPAGCNQGIEMAKGNYVVLLNNDVIVTTDWLKGLIECADSHPSIGIVGPMSNKVSGVQREANPGYSRVSRVPEFAIRYRRKNRRKWYEAPRIAGLCMLIKREVLEKVGGLDATFGIGNCEDDDYCLRSRLAGYRIAIAGDVFIHHFGSVSFGKDGHERYKEFIVRNELIFKDKWGITPLEWWREGKQITKTSPIYIPLRREIPLPPRTKIEGLSQALPKETTGGEKQTIESIYKGARELAINGKFDEAIMKFEELLSINPNHTDALNDLGALRFQKGEKDKAITLFRKSIEAYPLNIEAMRNLADIYLVSGRIEESMSALKDILSVRPNDQESMEKIGYICNLLGKAEDAAFFYSQAQQSPRNSDSVPVQR